MATSQEKHELIENIKFPDKYYRITIHGYGSEMVWNNITKECAEWWNKQSSGEAEDYMVDPEEYRKHNDMPQYADYLWNQDREYHTGWHEPPNESGHYYGVTSDSAVIDVDEVAGYDYTSKHISNVVEGVNFTDWFEKYDENVEVVEETLPSGWYAQMISNEKGTFFDGVLHLQGEKFDPNKLLFKEVEMPNGECIIDGVSYKTDDNTVMNNGGDTNGKGYSVHFYEDTYQLSHGDK